MPGAIVPYVKNDSRLSGIVYTGVSCQACGWSKPDDRAQHHELKCNSCKRSIGPRRAVQDRPQPPVVCSDCSSKHLSTNNPRPIQVRFDVRCPGCEKLLAHYDDWEMQILAKGVKVPTYFCRDPKCQIKFTIPVAKREVDHGQVMKSVHEVLSDLQAKKISDGLAAASVSRILVDPEGRNPLADR